MVTTEDRTNIKRTREVLTYYFIDRDKIRMSGELADLCSKREGAIAAKQTAAKAHASEIQALEEQIAETSRAVNRGSEKRMVECEWHMHEPREGWKTLWRLDSGELVTSEEMSYEEKQGSLFTEDIAEAALEAAEVATDEDPED